MSDREFEELYGDDGNTELSDSELALGEVYKRLRESEEPYEEDIKQVILFIEGKYPWVIRD